MSSSKGPGAAAAPPRRTQAERRADTQERLLDATIACLVDLGYANTTTREVARRAGVSRGAQTHHYPTKADLVVAAIERLFDHQIRQFRDGFLALPERSRTLDQALALLWEITRGPSFAAVLEVTVAGRTDPELRVVVHGVTALLERSVVDLLAELFPALGDERVARTVIDIGFTVVQGAAVSTYSGYGDPERTVRLVRAVAALLTPAHATLLEGALDVLDP